MHCISKVSIKNVMTKAAPHTFMKNQWELEKNFDYFHKNTKLAAKYTGPYQIVKVLLYNNI
jgi:hypothetical protein